MAAELVAGVEVGRTQNRNFLLAEGLKRLTAHSNVFNLCMRYSAQADRQYRRAIEDFDRLKALRPELPNETSMTVAPVTPENENAPVEPPHVFRNLHVFS